MGEIVSIHDHPLTGAQARNLDSSFVSSVGIPDDRAFLCYEKDEHGGFRRFSQKQDRQLAQLSTDITKRLDLIVTNSAGDKLEVPIPTVPLRRDKTVNDEVVIDEFGMATQAVDCGDEAAEWFKDFTGRDIRLARKKDHWRFFEQDPFKAKVAPLHIITVQSLNFIEKELGIEKDFGDRFRPNLVLEMEDTEPLTEFKWKALQIGGLTLKILKATERCPVPGNDQKTGEKMKDVPRLYPKFPKGPNGKAAFGVYAYAVLDPAHLETINVGNSVELVR